MTDFRTKTGWSGGLAERTEGETVYLSIAFTWRLRDAYQRALFWRAEGKRVVAGGPAVFIRKTYLADVAEIPMKTALDAKGREISVPGDRDDAVASHNPLATFASRGCPVGCWFCIVPKMEGLRFTLLPEFPVRPILCDNNLSALPVEYQEHIIERYEASGIPLVDANSGFEPRSFDGGTFERWKRILKGPWRFAYDDMKEREDVRRGLQILRDVRPNLKRIYVLIGNEPFAECMGRIREVLEWGGQPHVQPYIKLNALEKDYHVRYDWTRQKLLDVARWANRRVWKYASFDDYAGSLKSSPANEGQSELFTEAI